MEPKAVVEEVGSEVIGNNSTEINSTDTKFLDEQLSEVIGEISTPAPLTTEIPQVGDPTATPSYHTISGGPETLKEIATKIPPEPLYKQPTSFQVGGETFKKNPTPVKHVELDVPILPFFFLLVAIGIVIYFLKENGVTLEQIKQIGSIFRMIFDNLADFVKERAVL